MIAGADGRHHNIAQRQIVEGKAHRTSAAPEQRPERILLRVPAPINFVGGTPVNFGETENTVSPTTPKINVHD